MRSTLHSEKKTVGKDPIALVEEPFAELFTSRLMKGVVLTLFIFFNALVLRNSFLILSPTLSLSGDMHWDGMIYGLAISMLMVIILFHEERWDNWFCPGAVVLYLDSLILMLYMNWFGWLIGQAMALWLLGGLMVLMPVLGLFVMVAMLKR